jgi:hypothetical protein
MSDIAFPGAFPPDATRTHDHRPSFAVGRVLSGILKFFTGYAPPVPAGIAAGLLCFGFLTIWYALYVHYFFLGMWGGPFLFSTCFGIPPATAEAGVVPVCEDPIQGWDGQFYYHQSNDPFLIGDGPKYIPYPGYRYQRNFISMVAFVASRAVGYTVTPPLLYQMIQIGLASAGFGVLVWLLREHKLSSHLSLVWLLSGGVIWSMFCGLPDTPADALFIIAAAALYKKHLPTYLLAASMLVLCREGYALFSATVFGLTVLNLIDWNTGLSRWQRVALTTIPGFVVIGWAYFCAHQLGEPFLSHSGGSWGGLVDWPFAAFKRCLLIDVERNRPGEIFYKVVTAFGLIAIIVEAVRHARQSIIALTTIPYMVLMSMTGTVIWDGATGYFKAVSSVLMIGVLLLRYSKSDILRVALIANLVVGAYFTYIANYKTMQTRAPVDLNAVRISTKKPFVLPPVAPATILADAKCRMAVEAFNAEHRDQLANFPQLEGKVQMYSVTATNLGDSPWLLTAPGMNCVCLAIRVLNADGRSVYEGRGWLTADVAPTGSATFNVILPTPRKAGDYTVRFGMIQEGRFAFEEKDPESATSVNFTVP